MAHFKKGNLKVNSNEKVLMGTNGIIYYQFATEENNLIIGPNSNPDALKYDGGTGNWIFQSDYIWFKDTGDNTLASMAASGAVKLYYDGSRKLETVAGGVYITDESSTVSVIFSDTNLQITNLDGSTIQFYTQDSGTKQVANFDASGAVGLYYQGHVSLETQNDGIAIYDSNEQSFNIYIADHNVYLDNFDSGNITIQNNGSYVSAVFYANGASELYYQSDQKLTTTSTGIGVGVDDDTKGILEIYGAAETDGGELRLKSAGDGSFDYWSLVNEEGELQLTVDGDPQLTMYPDGSFEIGKDVGESTITASTLYLNTDNVEVGLEDSKPGLMAIMGGGDTEAGGELRLHLPADQDTTIDYYTLNVPAGTDDLYIGPDTNPDALKYDANYNYWVFSSVRAVFDMHVVEFGAYDQTFCTVEINGDDFVSGKINLYMGSTFFGDSEKYIIQCNEDDLLIGPEENEDSLKYSLGSTTWIFTETVQGPEPTNPSDLVTKNYVDAAVSTIGGETYSGKVNIPQDSTSVVVSYDIAQVDSNYSLTTHIVNKIDSAPLIYTHMTTDYDKDGFTELFSESINSPNYYLHFILSRNELSSSSSSSSSSKSSSSSSKSSSSSSSSSLSSGSSSSSISSSTLAIASYLSGFPRSPNYISVTIGAAWLPASNLSEDEVVNLYQASSHEWTEDGTLIGNPTTNRLKLRYHNLQFLGQVPLAGTYWQNAWNQAIGWGPYNSSTPYVFKDAWLASRTIAGDLSFLTSNSVNFQNIFKSFDFVSV
jgi:hypothetical protein